MKTNGMTSMMGGLVKEPRDWAGLGWAAVLFSIALLLVVAGVSSWQEDLNFADKQGFTDAKIAYRREALERKPAFAVYRFTAEGKSYSGRLVGLSVDKGDILPVRYDLSNPAINAPSGGYGSAGNYFVMALVATGIGVFMFMSSYSDSTAWHFKTDNDRPLRIKVTPLDRFWVIMSSFTAACFIYKLASGIHSPAFIVAARCAIALVTLFLLHITDKVELKGFKWPLLGVLLTFNPIFKLPIEGTPWLWVQGVAVVYFGYVSFKCHPSEKLTKSEVPKVLYQEAA